MNAIFLILGFLCLILAAIVYVGQDWRARRRAATRNERTNELLMAIISCANPNPPALRKAPFSGYNIPHISFEDCTAIGTNLVDRYFYNSHKNDTALQEKHRFMYTIAEKFMKKYSEEAIAHEKKRYSPTLTYVLFGIAILMLAAGFITS